MRRFFGAVQFLTTVPVHGATSSPGEAAPFFPVVGALLGAAAGAVLLWKGPLSALVALLLLLIATGCLHEDGLADVADAVRAGRSRERILAILKDSRIGTYGAVALMLSIVVRWQAMSQCAVHPIGGVAGALALSRGSMVVLARITPPAGDGLGRSFSSQISGQTAVFVCIGSLLLAGLAGWKHAVSMSSATAAILLLARPWFIRRLGGVTGDCLGATSQVVEAANLLVLTWRPFF